MGRAATPAAMAEDSVAESIPIAGVSEAAAHETSDRSVRKFRVNGCDVNIAKFSPEVEKGLKEGGGEQWKIWINMIQQQAAAVLGTEDIKYIRIIKCKLCIFS